MSGQSDQQDFDGPVFSPSSEGFPPVCPVCRRPAELVDGAEIYREPEAQTKKYWVCHTCDTRVGCYAGSIRPLGGLANAEVRAARRQAHAAFDPLWCSAKRVRRRQARITAYVWLAKQLGSSVICHIGQMDVETCRRVVELCSNVELTAKLTAVVREFAAENKAACEVGLAAWRRLDYLRSQAVDTVIPAIRSSRLLCDFILPSGFDFERGTYIPLTHKVGLLPAIVAYRSKRIAKKFKYLGSDILRTPINPTLFANGQLIPDALGTPFIDLGATPPAKKNATNIGFVVATMEIDCETRGDFDATLAQLSILEQTEDSPPDALDHWLRQVPEYRGYCVVFSGRRSVHFHFVYSTKHLVCAPYDQDASSRSTFNRIRVSELMHAVHWLYWDHTAAAFSRFFQAGPRPDPALRAITQYRRVPWGMRKLEKPGQLLSLDVGTPVVQLVLSERIHDVGAEFDANEYLAPPQFGMAY